MRGLLAFAGLVCAALLAASARAAEPAGAADPAGERRADVHLTGEEPGDLRPLTEGEAIALRCPAIVTALVIASCGYAAVAAIHSPGSGWLRLGEPVLLWAAVHFTFIAIRLLMRSGADLLRPGPASAYATVSSAIVGIWVGAALDTWALLPLPVFAIATYPAIKKACSVSPDHRPEGFTRWSGGILVGELMGYLLQKGVQLVLV